MVEPLDRGAAYRGARLRLALSVCAMASAALLIPFVARSCRSKHAPEVPRELLNAGAKFPEAPTDLPPSVPLEPLLAADAPDRLAVMEPTETALNLRPGDPLVVRFNRPMVDGAHVGKPISESPLRFSPKVAGTATWTSRGTLSFEAAPPTWRGTHTSTMELSPALRSLAGEEVVEPPSHTIVFDDGPHLVGRPKSSRLLPGEPVRLVFSGNVDPQALDSALLVYEVDGGQRMLPFSIARPTRDPKGQTLVDLVLKTRLEPGAQLAVAIAPPLSQGGSHPRVIELSLTPRPHIEGIDCPAETREASQCKFTESPGEIVDIAQSVRLLSSEDLGALSPGAIEVTPHLDGFTTQIEEGKEVVVSGDWTPGQVYQVRVSGLRDKAGHDLLRMPPLAVRSAGRPPEVRAASGQLTFEHDALPRLAIAGIHIDRGEARIAAVPVGAELDALVSPDRLVATEKPGSFLGVPLSSVLPTSRANRWATGTLGFAELSPTHPSMLVLSLLADKTNAPASLPTTFIQQTDLGIDAQVLPGGVALWVTSIADAKPVIGTKVLIADRSGLPIALDATDDRGVVWFPVLDATRLDGGVIVRAVSGADRAMMVVDPRTSMGPRHLGMTPGEAQPSTATLVATVFTDRGIARPGETLHAKAIARTRVDGALVAPEPRDATLALFGPNGVAPLAEHTATLSAFGTVDADFALSTIAEPGSYRVELAIAGQSERAGIATFTVGDYRPPAFRVDLSAPARDLVERDTLAMDVVATHMFGPPAAGMAAHWTITRESGTDPERWDDYAFSPVDAAMRTGTMAAGDVKLDDRGRATITAPVEIGTSVRADAVVEISVNDVSGLSTSTRRTVPLYPATFEVGVHQVPAWIEPGTTLDVDAIVIAHDGTPVKGRTIEARIVRESWHAYWEWAGGKKQNDDGDVEPEERFQARRAHRIEVAHRCKLTSSDTAVHCTYEPERSGTYVLEAVTRDERGRTSTASQRVYVAGPDEHPDRDAPGARLELTPQKSELLVGDTAEIAFESPFPDAEARIQVARDGLLTTEVRRVASGGNVFRFPVTEQMVPNAFVSLSLVRPRTSAPGEKLDLGAPDLRVGLTEITVRPKASPLVVTLDADHLAQAGTDVAIDVFVKNASGVGTEAEVALFAVDEGSLRVTGYQIPDPTSGWFTRMAPAFAWEDLRRSLVSRITEPLLPGAGGDGAGSASKLSPEQLDRFEPTPLWLPHLSTDATGHAEAVLHLPARPTQYRIMAVATDAGIRAGIAEQTVVATMPLVVRPVLPSTATVGDRFLAVAFLHNTEDTPVDVTVTPDVDGFQRAPILVRVEANGEARVSEWIDVEKPGDLMVRFETRSERGEADAEARVRVAPRGRVVHSTAVGAVEGHRTLSVQVPDGDARSFTLAIAAHPFVGFDTALDALLASDDAGVEATASSLLGLAAYAALDMDKRPGAVRPDELDARAREAIARLLAMQTPSGGFGDFTRHDSPENYLTAFALHALSAAERAGFRIDPAARGRASAFLEAQIRSNSFLDNKENGTGHDELAFALRALAEAEAPDAERTNALFDQRERLTPYGLSELALAMDPNDSRRMTLVDGAQSRVLATREDEAENASVLRWYDSSARTLGAVLEAASSTESMLDVTPRLASRLLRTRSGESAAWWSSHETSCALSALSAYAGTLRSDDALDARVTMDGAPIVAVAASRQHLSYVISPEKLSGGPHQVRIEVNGVAWFAVGGGWTVPLGPVDEVARGKEATLHRTFEDASGKPIASGAHLRLGDLVRVRLFLYSEHEAPPYVAVRDHLAGGLEPIDGDHETSPRESLSALLGVGPDDEVTDVRAHYANRSVDVITHRAFVPGQAAFYLAHAGTGLHELTYGVRAVSAGTFVLPPAEVEALYARGFSARSTLATFTVDP